MFTKITKKITSIVVPATSQKLPYEDPWWTRPSCVV